MNTHSKKQALREQKKGGGLYLQSEDKKLKILVTGGTGFIGNELTRCLLDKDFHVTILSRFPDLARRHCGIGVNVIGHFDEIKADDTYNIVINLAGAPIFGARWSDSRKEILRDSRIKFTQKLVSCMSSMAIKPELLISGSAIGYYGYQGDIALTEQSATKTDFSQQLCFDWEHEANKATELGVRVCLIRTGLVLGKNGGLLGRMLLLYKLGLGGRLGNGRQWMSWIHRKDWVAIALRMIAEPSMQGSYNATTPNPVSNDEFSHTLANTLKRPALLPLPAWLLKKLLGEMSELVLGSQRVLPERLLAEGFEFQYSNLSNALVDIIEPKVY